MELLRVILTYAVSKIKPRSFLGLIPERWWIVYEKVFFKMKVKIPCGQRPLNQNIRNTKKTSSLDDKLHQTRVKHSVSIHSTEDISQ